MADVTLTSAMRSNLLSLQRSAELLDRTQLRLSTGRAVNSVLDDAVKYFTAEGLNQRANLLSDRKTDINNAISAVTAASNGITGIKSSIQQLKSLVTQARSALAAADGATTREAVATQYNTVMTQINNLVKDASYNGVNFLQKDPGTLAPTELTVYFNEESSTSLTVKGFDSTTKGLNITKGATPTYDVSSASATQGVYFDGASNNKVEVTAATDALSITLGGITISRNGSASGTNVTVTNGLATSTLVSNEAGSAVYKAADGYINVTKTSANALTITYTKDQAGTVDAAGEISITQAGAADSSVLVTVHDGSTTTTNNDVYTLTADGATDGSFAQSPDTTAPTSAFFATADYVASDFDSAAELDALDAKLNAALATLQAESSKLSGNVSILQTRNNFIKDLSNTLIAGADKLTLADTNEEGANMLALQTQQQLGVTSLSLAAQALQGVLRLF